MGEEEEVDSLEQFRRVILTGWHGNIAPEITQKLRDDDELIALDPFKLEMVGSYMNNIPQDELRLSIIKSQSPHDGTVRTETICRKKIR